MEPNGILPLCGIPIVRPEGFGEEFWMDIAPAAMDLCTGLVLTDKRNYLWMIILLRPLTSKYIVRI
jgi:hypothetical protein